MEKQDLSSFQGLQKNFEQKIFIMFGNKLRAYEKNNR